MISFITRTLSVIMLIACLITLFAPVSLAQVEAETGVSTEDLYVVQQDDTLYELAGVRRSNPELWRQVVAVNPFLQEKGRLFDRDGKTIVLIRPGEKLVGLGRLGVIAERVPFDRLAPAPMPVPTPTPVPIDDSWPLWAKIMIALLALIVALIITIIISVMRGGRLARRLGVHVTDVETNDPLNGQTIAPRRARPLPPLELPTIVIDLDADPATAGTPFDEWGTSLDEMVEGDALELVYREYARIHDIESSDLAVLYALNFEIVNVEAGIIDGIMIVRYLNGPDRLIRMNNVKGFRVTVKFPDEEQTRTLYSVRACANPARAENERENVGQEGFTFTPTTSTQSVEEPVVSTPVSVEEQGALKPAVAITSENFFDEMVKLGVLTEQDVQQAQASQSEPPYVITVDGDRTTVNGVAIVGARGIDLKGGNVCVILPQRGLEPAELHFSPSGEISGFPGTEPKSEPANGADKGNIDDIAMATVS